MYNDEIPFGTLSSYLRRQRAVVVYFSSKYCGPCRNMPPLLERLRQLTRADIVKVSVDGYPEQTRQYGIMSVPTVVVFVRGQEASRIAGVPTLTQLTNLVRTYV